MIRQTKATLTAWAVTGVLTAGLVLFGCNRQAGDGQDDEHLHEDHLHETTQHNEPDEATDAGRAGEHAHSE